MKKYDVELRRKRELLLEIRRAEKEKGTITLLYSAKDEKHNQAVALSALLRETESMQNSRAARLHQQKTSV